jgi:hypothetical protein
MKRSTPPWKQEAATVSRLSLSAKLKLKAGQRAAVIGAPSGYLDRLAPLPPGVVLTTSLRGIYDWIQVFARGRRELDASLPRACRALASTGRLWLAFPKASSKQQSDLTRDRGWEAVKAERLKWVTLVAIDEVWSAFCVRPYLPGEKQA